ncbi:MAG: ParB/RepB/Spo0J family partition protein [Treponemataceae bacterium]|nr:MAG: ParB/RepB/Spo0J family partition protein [Treponemataceae bacterium]
MAKAVLGRGLDALLGDADESFSASLADAQGDAPRLPAGITRGNDGVLFAEIEKLLPNPYQPRREFEGETLAELADSIRKHGVIQPVTIEEATDGNFYIIAGERRCRAAKLAGLSHIPAQVKKYSDSKKLEIALIENIQREDLNPLEEARAYEELMRLNNLNQDETAKRVGKKRSTVANALRLLRLSGDMQAAVADGSLSAGHARAVLSVGDETGRRALYEKIIAEGMSVRQAEKAAQSLNGETTDDTRKERRENGKSNISRNPDLIFVEQKFIDALGTKVSIKGGIDKGTILVEYFSREDLDRLYEIITQ